jgi:predicted DNA-binding transcriptional regulator AlpA
VALILTSWKEIAAYLGKGVRTVQRWESELQLPVRRPVEGNRQLIVALSDEIDAWLQSRFSCRPGDISASGVAGKADDADDGSAHDVRGAFSK